MDTISDKLQQADIIEKSPSSSFQVTKLIEEISTHNQTSDALIFDTIEKEVQDKLNFVEL